MVETVFLALHLLGPVGSCGSALTNLVATFQVADRFDADALAEINQYSGNESIRLDVHGDRESLRKLKNELLDSKIASGEIQDSAFHLTLPNSDKARVFLYTLKYYSKVSVTKTKPKEDSSPEMSPQDEQKMEEIKVDRLKKLRNSTRFDPATARILENYQSGQSLVLQVATPASKDSEVTLEHLREEFLETESLDMTEFKSDVIPGTESSKMFFFVRIENITQLNALLIGLMQDEARGIYVRLEKRPWGEIE